MSINTFGENFLCHLLVLPRKCYRLINKLTSRKSDWSQDYLYIRYLSGRMSTYFCRAHTHNLHDLCSFDLNIWAAMWGNVPSGMCAQRRFSMRIRLIRIFTGRILNRQGCKIALCGQHRLIKQGWFKSLLTVRQKVGFLSLRFIYLGKRVFVTWLGYFTQYILGRHE